MHHLIDTPKATYLLIVERGYHFAIDCACKGTEGIYHGSRYKKATTLEQKTLERSNNDHARMKYQQEHTFYMNDALLSATIENHDLRFAQQPLIIICNDCSQEFPFTPASYTTLIEQLSKQPPKL